MQKGFSAALLIFRVAQKTFCVTQKEFCASFNHSKRQKGFCITLQTFRAVQKSFAVASITVGVIEKVFVTTPLALSESKEGLL